MGSLRAAAEAAERAKEGLRADNTRLTHRISYLEEQVAEMRATHAQVSTHEARMNKDPMFYKVNISQILSSFLNIDMTPPQFTLRL